MSRLFRRVVLWSLQIVAVGLIGTAPVAARADEGDEPAAGEKPAAEEQKTLDRESFGRLIQQMRALLADKKFAEVGKLVAAKAKEFPEDRNVQLLAASVTQSVAFGILNDPTKRKEANQYFHASAKYARHLKKILKGNIPPAWVEQYATILYNDACSFALDGDKDRALEVLKEAVDAGFREYNVIKDDADFQSLRDDPKYRDQFQKLVDQVKAKSKAGGPRIRT